MGLGERECSSGAHGLVLPSLVKHSKPGGKAVQDSLKGGTAMVRSHSSSFLSLCLSRFPFFYFFFFFPHTLSLPPTFLRLPRTAPALQNGPCAPLSVPHPFRTPARSRSPSVTPPGTANLRPGAGQRGDVITVAASRLAACQPAVCPRPAPHSRRGSAFPAQLPVPDARDRLPRHVRPPAAPPAEAPRPARRGLAVVAAGGASLAGRAG